MKKIPVRQIRPAEHEKLSPERFSIRRVEQLLDKHDLFHELHRHDFFFIIALRNAEGSHEIDFTIYNVLNHSVFFMRPGQVHQLQLQADATGFIVEFNKDFYRTRDKQSGERLRKANYKAYCKLEIKVFEKLHTILTNIFQEYHAREEGYLDAIRANLDIFFIEFLRQRPNTKEQLLTNSPYAQDRFEAFIDLLETHISTCKQVFQYTDLMNLSAYQLNEITKATVGKTASELITEHIILEAKRYLLATTDQIKEIADLLGYEDTSYFIRLFKKQTGSSPEAFRHNHR